jgi:proline reductase-associated electron transfer protein PrdC
LNKLYPISLKQHIGSINTPVVSVGESVQKGSLIAVPNGSGANIHSSVHGKVKEISDESILVEADIFQSEEYKKIPEGLSNLESIKEAGIVGMGGAGFPTHIKLNVDLKGGIVIINGAECEPLLEHNIEQLSTAPDLVYRGLKYVMEITNAKQGVLAVKSKNTEAIRAFKKVINEENIYVVELQDMYPVGEERAVIKAVLDILLDPTQLPSAADAVVINVETLTRITEAIELRKPVISKNITIVGNFNNEPISRVYKDVPIGTTIDELINRTGTIESEYGEIILGGPFTGVSAKINDPITKTSGGIIVTMPFMRDKRKMGLLICACSANEKRMREIASHMGSEIVSVQKCKQAVEVNGALKCEDPGNCPGQAEKVINFKKAGAEVILMGNCSDCSNTVMCSAPKLKLPVYHVTDHVMRTVGHPLVRRLK